MKTNIYVMDNDQIEKQIEEIKNNCQIAHWL